MAFKHAQGPLDGLKIAQVERLTGVGAHTLRAWERRYGVPRPGRSDGRQRLYTVNDVEVIRRMQELANSGLALRRAAMVVLGERDAKRPRSGTARVPGEIERFLHCLLEYDERRALRLWGNALDAVDLLTMLEDLVVPTLVHLGEAWHNGQAGVEQEHFASGFIRSRLEALARQSTPVPGAPRAVLACLAGERHELALLMLNVLLRFQGIATIYLGQDVPDDALVRSVRQLTPRSVCLGAGTAASCSRLPSIAAEIRQVAPAVCVLFGGRAADDEPARQQIAGAIYGGRTLRQALATIVSETRRRPGRVLS